MAKVSQVWASKRQTLSPGSVPCPHVIINRILAINGAKVRLVEETIKTRLSPGVCPRVIINRLLAINGVKVRLVKETIKNKAFARHFLIFSHNNLYV